jgi:hypothetical protein
VIHSTGYPQRCKEGWAGAKKHIFAKAGFEPKNIIESAEQLGFCRRTHIFSESSVITDPNLDPFQSLISQ